MIIKSYTATTNKQWERKRVNHASDSYNVSGPIEVNNVESEDNKSNDIDTTRQDINTLNRTNIKYFISQNK